MSEVHLCPEHGTPMKESKHREGEFYCPKKVGDHPQTGKALYCSQTWKPGDTDAAPPPVPASPPTPPPVQYRNNLSPADKARLTRMDCLQAAATLYRGLGTELSDEPAMYVVEAAKYMYEWTMNGDAPAPPPAEDVEQTEGSDWHKRGAVITMARLDIPYYDHARHVINTLARLEARKQIAWGDSDEAILAQLDAYAQKRANEKAADND